MNELSMIIYNYTLPKELIAQSAHHPSDECKLLVVSKNGQLEHKRFLDITEFLRVGDVVVVNQTKVSHTKLVGHKRTGGKAEVILTRPLGELNYEARIKAGKLRVGVVLVFSTCTATITGRQDDVFTLSFDRAHATADLTFPTPPYIEKPVPEQDYQTMFAKQEGSLAAPTAALHFTPALVRKLESSGVRFVAITLHIGFGTFLPVHDIATHKTEPEQIEITQESASAINSATRVIAVGTTTVKALETASKEGKVKAYTGTSNIFITPGYVFQSRIDAMITNFHLPKSSLLMLTCAYGKTDRIMGAYAEAVREQYRFYSLGDAMLVWK